MNYSSQMFEVMQTDKFEEWLDGLRDRKGQEVVAKRIIRMQSGLLGDVKAVGNGVSEARIKFGPGYRLYFVKRHQVIIILLCGGDKGSQSRDIARAKEMAKEV